MGLDAQVSGIREFFDETIPLLVRSKPSAFSTLNGRICFRVRAVDDWTLDLGNTEKPVISKASVDADLVLSFTSNAFSEFIDGTLDIEKRLAKGEIAFDGNVQLLEKFGWFMQSTRDFLSVRE